MVDREKVLAVLKNRFPHATTRTIAAAANAIVGLDEEWEEVGHQELDATGERAGLPDIRIYRRRSGWRQHGAPQARDQST